MSRRFRSPALVGLCSAAIAAACATEGGARGYQSSPGVPTAIALPPDEAPALKLEARGTQNYECRPKQGSPGQGEWVLVAPEADLFDATGKKVGKHYAGPSWESIEDGSKVVGKVEARADAPEPDAIPWLRLGTTETAGQGMFAAVKSVQRLDTHGGKAPAAACGEPGETIKVPYSAVYTFSRKKG